MADREERLHRLRQLLLSDITEERREERALVERERVGALTAFALECSNRLADVAVMMIARGDSLAAVQMVMREANFCMGDFAQYG